MESCTQVVSAALSFGKAIMSCTCIWRPEYRLYCVVSQQFGSGLID